MLVSAVVSSPHSDARPKPPAEEPQGVSSLKTRSEGTRIGIVSPQANQAVAQSDAPLLVAHQCIANDFLLGRGHNQDRTKSLAKGFVRADRRSPHSPIYSISAMRPSNRKRANVEVALLLVVGVTMLDILGATAIAARHRRGRGERRQYRDRSGFPKGLQAARGAAKDFTTPRAMRVLAGRAGISDRSQQQGQART